MDGIIAYLSNTFLKRHVHVKPLDNTLFGDVWLITSHNWFEELLDDWRRYGARVAIANAVMTIRIANQQSWHSQNSE